MFFSKSHARNFRKVGRMKFVVFFLTHVLHVFFTSTGPQKIDSMVAYLRSESAAPPRYLMPRITARWYINVPWSPVFQVLWPLAVSFMAIALGVPGFISPGFAPMEYMEPTWIQSLGRTQDIVIISYGIFLCYYYRSCLKRLLIIVLILREGRFILWGILCCIACSYCKDLRNVVF